MGSSGINHQRRRKVRKRTKKKKRRTYSSLFVWRWQKERIVTETAETHRNIWCQHSCSWTIVAIVLCMKPNVKEYNVLTLQDTRQDVFRVFQLLRPALENKHCHVSMIV